MELSALQPREVWRYFLDICNIPRPSGHETGLVKYIEQFAQTRGLKFSVDSNGNSVVFKPATKGFEDREGVILQSHLDMVCEKDANVVHDFYNDPINLILEGDWLKARGTTLGADNGIGIAMQLALLDSGTAMHPNLECLFTTDEEAGMTGVKNLQPGFVTGKFLINLDSEDDEEIFIGCAGGIDTRAVLAYSNVDTPASGQAFCVGIKGLKGGHSGDDIHRGYGNAIRLLARFIFQCQKSFDVLISEFSGGNLPNAIPREATAIIVIPSDKSEAFKQFAQNYNRTLGLEYKLSDPGVEFTFQSNDLPASVIDTQSARKLIYALVACYNGVFGWSTDMPGLVETSTNLASVKMQGKHQILITTSQRSSVESRKLEIMQSIEAAFYLAGMTVCHGDGYPGWKPNPESHLLKIASSVYQHLFHALPRVRAIHAGLECGLLIDKYPWLDAISIGPSITGAHSPLEKINVVSVAKTWQYLLELVSRL